MKEKEKWIIEAAMQLFAKKGFSSTSVQDIATESGISKGAFYLYFESKETLLLAIFQYYSNRIQQRVMEVEGLHFSQRELFERQIEVQLEEIMQHKAFIVMLIREFSIPYNADIAAFVHRIRMESNTFYRTKLIQVYGEGIERYSHDLTLLVHGILGACNELILLNRAELSPARVAAYIMNRIDSLVSGMLASAEEPLLLSEEWMQLSSCGAAPGEADTKTALLQAVSAAADAAAKQAGSEHLAVTLDLLRQEMAAEAGRLPLIEGMLHNLGAYPELRALRDEVRSCYGLQL